MTLTKNKFDSVSERLSEIIRRAKEASLKAGVDNTPAEIIAVSKRQPDEKIKEALDFGHRLFGENRVQEAITRWTEQKPRYPDLRLHLIGPLQTNKVGEAVAFFDAIETVDRPKLARALASQMSQQKRYPDCYVQVNTGEEPQKSGIFPSQAENFINFCRFECKINIIGLMCIPPINEEAAMHFALLRKIAEKNNIKKLSMGMSSDFETALEFGATSVRIGSAIFGERNH